MSPTTDSRKILRERAIALAKPREVAATRGDEIEVVEFAIREQRFALPVVDVRAIEDCSAIVPVPCTPAWVAGVINVRSEIITVIDLGVFFELTTPGRASQTRALIVSTPAMTVALAVDAITGTRKLSPEAVQPPLPGTAALRSDFVRGVTIEGVTLLETSRLFSEDTLVVNESIDT
jgi:purine-binding chemotaxis protein CheW